MPAGFDFSFTDSFIDATFGSAFSPPSHYGSLDPKGSQLQRMPVGEPQAQSFWEDECFTKKFDMLKRASSLGESPTSKKLSSHPLQLGRDDSFAMTMKFPDCDLGMYNGDDFGEFDQRHVPQYPGLTIPKEMHEHKDEGNMFLPLKQEVSMVRLLPSDDDTDTDQDDSWDGFHDGLNLDDEQQMQDTLALHGSVQSYPALNLTPINNSCLPASFPRQLVHPPAQAGQLTLQALHPAELVSSQHKEYRAAHVYTPEPLPEGKTRRGRAPRCASAVVVDAIHEINLSLRALTDRPADLYNSDFEDRVTIGKYSKVQRRAKILRFKAKRRKAELAGRQVLYKCRKKFADARPRVGGRFVKLNPKSRETIERRQQHH